MLSDFSYPNLISIYVYTWIISILQLNEWRDQIAAFAVNPADPSDNILRSTGTASTNTTMTLYRRPSGATIAPTNAPTNARRSAADISEETHAAEGAAGGAAYAPGFSASSSTSSSSSSKDAKKKQRTEKKADEAKEPKE